MCYVFWALHNTARQVIRTCVFVFYVWHHMLYVTCCIVATCYVCHMLYLECDTLYVVCSSVYLICYMLCVAC